MQIKIRSLFLSLVRNLNRRAEHILHRMPINLSNGFIRPVPLAMRLEQSVRSVKNWTNTLKVLENFSSHHLTTMQRQVNTDPVRGRGLVQQRVILAVVPNPFVEPHLLAIDPIRMRIVKIINASIFTSENERFPLDERDEAPAEFPVKKKEPRVAALFRPPIRKNVLDSPKKSSGPPTKSEKSFVFVNREANLSETRRNSFERPVIKKARFQEEDVGIH